MFHTPTPPNGPSGIEDNGAGPDLRAHYSGVAEDAIRVLWRRKWLIATTSVIGLTSTLAVLACMGPRYTGEALIPVALSRDVGGNAPSQAIAAVDAAEVVNSVARIIRSRANVDAVVTRLGLDKDPKLQRKSRPSQLLSDALSMIGLHKRGGTPHELAIDKLMAQTRVTAEPRSYVISTAVTAGDPDTAARLANAIAREYLHQQRVQEIAEARVKAEQDLANASLIYGPRHPIVLQAKAKYDRLDLQIAALREMPADRFQTEFAGRMIAAGKVMQPSGPNSAAYLLLTLIASAGVGVGLARYTRIGFFGSLAARLLHALVYAVAALFRLARLWRSARVSLRARRPAS